MTRSLWLRFVMGAIFMCTLSAIAIDTPVKAHKVREMPAAFQAAGFRPDRNGTLSHSGIRLGTLCQLLGVRIADFKEIENGPPFHFVACASFRTGWCSVDCFRKPNSGRVGDDDIASAVIGFTR